MKKKKLELNKDTLLVLETTELRSVAAGIVAPKSAQCTAAGCTPTCPTMGPGCPEPTTPTVTATHTVP